MLYKCPFCFDLCGSFYCCTWDNWKCENALHTNQQPCQGCFRPMSYAAISDSNNGRQATTAPLDRTLGPDCSNQAPVNMDRESCGIQLRSLSQQCRWPITRVFDGAEPRPRPSPSFWFQCTHGSSHRPPSKIAHRGYTQITRQEQVHMSSAQFIVQALKLKEVTFPIRCESCAVGYLMGARA